MEERMNDQARSFMAAHNKEKSDYYTPFVEAICERIHKADPPLQIVKS